MRWYGVALGRRWNGALHSKTQKFTLMFLHSAQQKQTFKFQATEQDLVILRFRSKNSLQLTWSTIAVGTSSDEGNFCFCATNGNTGFETEDFAT